MLAGEALISKEQKSKVNADDIVSWADGQLKTTDIIVHPFRLDWGNGEQYPLDSMIFYESETPDLPCTMHTNRFETN